MTSTSINAIYSALAAMPALAQADQPLQHSAAKLGQIFYSYTCASGYCTLSDIDAAPIALFHNPANALQHILDNFDYIDINDLQLGDNYGASGLQLLCNGQEISFNIFPMQLGD